MSADNIFMKIIRGEIPCRKVYEDDQCLAFHDINPIAPVHLLLIPKRHIESLQVVTAQDAALLGHMMTLIPRLAQENGANDGFRVVANNGRDGMQEVPHLHFHIIGGARPWKTKAAAMVA